VDPERLTNEEPIFLELTFDAKLFHCDWLIIGNMQDKLAIFPQPTFSVRRSDTVHIEA